MKRSFLLIFFGVALSLCALTSAAQAQATRTWVSGVGDDANPCSRTAPCKTFAGAISRTAAGGEIDALDPGGFGTLTITKSITIDGGGGIVSSVLAAGSPPPPGFTVNAGANDTITLRNISIQGVNQGSNGINFVAGLNLNVEHCVIQNFTNLGIDFEPVVRAFLTIRDSVIEGNAGGGLVNATTATSGKNRASIIHSAFLNNGSSGTFGIKGGLTSRTQVTDSLVVGNGGLSGDGVLGDGADGIINLETTTVSNNHNGVHSRNSSQVQLSNTTVTFNNGNGLFFESSGQLLSFGQNRVSSNISDGTFSGTLPLH